MSGVLTSPQVITGAAKVENQICCRAGKMKGLEETDLTLGKTESKAAH